MSPIKPILILSSLLIILNVPTANAADNVLYSGERLTTEQSLTNNDYTLSMQEDCDLVLYNHTEFSWSTNTSGFGSNCYCEMQDNGLLVLFKTNEDGTSEVVWTTRKPGETGLYALVLHENGALVIHVVNIWDDNVKNDTRTLRRGGPVIPWVGARNRKVAWASLPVNSGVAIE